MALNFDPSMLDDTPIQKANIVPARFFIKYKQVTALGPDGKQKETGKLEAEEWVEWHIKLTGNQTIARTCINSIKRIQKGAKAATEPYDEYAAIWRTLEPFYQNWKEGRKDEIITGTPLSIWPGITQDAVELLRPFRVLSVEDLSMLGDAVLNKIQHPDIMMFRDRAKKFLATKDIAMAVRELDETKAELAEMRKLKQELDDLRKIAAEAAMHTKNAAAEAEDASPASLGRKRKSAA